MKKLLSDYNLLPINEKANVLTHGLAFIVATFASITMLMTKPVSIEFFGICAFSFGMLFMLMSSTIYHFMINDTLKEKWRIVDHISIFTLIGCSYTPFVLYYYKGISGLQFLAIHWLIVIIGIIFKLRYKSKYEYISLAFYLVLGWMVMFIYDTITPGMQAEVLFYLLMGGLSYTIGVIFYVWHKPKFNHAIWHIFVIMGCTCHYLALFFS